MIPRLRAAEALEQAIAIGTVLFGEPEDVGRLVERATGSEEAGRTAEHGAKVAKMKSASKKSWR